MTITNTNRKITYTGNGSTTVFSYGFIIPTAADANVALYEIATGILAAPLDPSVYSITGLGNVAGGSVTYPLSGSPLASTHKIVIYRSVAFEQVTNLTNQSAYLPEVLEDQLDILVMMSQELSEEVSRGVKVTLGSGDDPDTLIATLTAQSAAATASASAAATSETNAANSATAAAADAVSTAADVVSTNADVLLTAADVISTGNDVTSTNADVVSTNADVASTNADVVTSGNSATAAATSETNAATSETNAATSATNAAASYDSFDDRYLGAKAADPTLDNDGNALLTGALYWNTGSNEMRAYSGSAWVASYIPSSDYLALAGGTMTGVLNMGGKNVTKVNSAFLTEQAAADADVAGDGQVWVKAQTPNIPMFTDDAGNDFNLNKIVQIVNVQDGLLATGTTAMPTDDTIPQNTEGDQYLSLPITPTNSNNKLLIVATVNVSSSTNNSWIKSALFQDTIADALAAGITFNETGTATAIITFSHYMTAGTTSSTTFKIRIGGGGTVRLNGGTGSGARLLGGVLASSITITEIAV